MAARVGDGSIALARTLDWEFPQLKASKAAEIKSDDHPIDCLFGFLSQGNSSEKPSQKNQGVLCRYFPQHEILPDGKGGSVLVH